VVWPFDSRPSIPEPPLTCKCGQPTSRIGGRMCADCMRASIEQWQQKIAHDDDKKLREMRPFVQCVAKAVFDRIKELLEKEKRT